MRFNARLAVVTAALLPVSSPAWSEPIQLDGIVVTTTKTKERAIDSLSASTSIGGTQSTAPKKTAMQPDVPAETVAASGEADSTIGATGTTDRSTIQQLQPNSVSELLRDVPGVETSDNHNDPAQSIGIRGLQDFGRVNVMVDGARQDFQITGHARNGTFYLEPELIGGVDITRGPTATIYGSGAVGGVVNFATNSVDSVLRPDEKAGAVQKLGFDTNGNNFVTSTMLAARSGTDFDIFGQYVYRRSDDYLDGHGDEVKDTGREDPYAGAFKLRWRPQMGSEITAGVVAQQVDFRTFTLLTPSELNSLPPGFGPTEYNSTVNNEIYSLGYTFSRPDNDWLNLSLKGYISKTSLDQSEVLTPADTRSFDIETIGFDVSNTSRFATGVFAHAVTYGGDGFHDRVNNAASNPNDDAPLFTPSGAREAFGTFVQDEVRYADWLRVIGALRYDTYSLDGNGVSTDGDHLSPKITMGVTPIKGIEVYGTYAQAYRAPAISETLVSGVHPDFGPGVPGFTFVPNPNLKPEIAKNAEIGVNVQYNSIFRAGDAFRAKADYFHNNVEDFIDTVGGAPGGTLTYENIAEAKLEGVELEATYDWGSGFATLSGAHIRGTDVTTGQPLTTVPADRIASTIGFRFFDNRLTVGERLTFVAAQDRVPQPVSRQIYQPTPSYHLLDLFASYNYSEDLRFDLRVDNVLDKYYINYLDLDPSPGISAKFAVTMKLGAGEILAGR